MASILDELKAKANGAADQANNIQEAVSMMAFGGGSGGILYVGQSWSEELQANVLDKTWQELWDAFNADKIIILKNDSLTDDGHVGALGRIPCVSVGFNIPYTSNNSNAQASYTVTFLGLGGATMDDVYTTNTASGYPSL